MSQIEESEDMINNKVFEQLFTDFDGILNARLSAVIPNRSQSTYGNENAPISAKYDCRIKIPYHKSIMTILEEGMILAVKNFRNKNNDNGNNSIDLTPTEQKETYTLLVISRIWADHYGLRALSDHTYYPMQFEVIEQSVPDWDTDDKSTMMIQASAIPINYDLVVYPNDESNGNMKYEYKKGFTYPVIGDRAFVLNAKTVSQMYNQKILKKMGLENETDTLKLDTFKIGTIKMFEDSIEKIPIYVDFDNIVRYHFGIFAFTGGGKSNLLSNILRKIIHNTEDIKIVLFDISCEYPFLLMDLFADESIKSRIILENQVSNSEQFNISVVKPREFEEDEKAKKGLEKIFERQIVNHYVKPDSGNPICRDILNDLKGMRNDNAGKPNYLEAINEIRKNLIDHMVALKLIETDFIDEKFVQVLITCANEAMKRYKINTNANLYSWATTRDTLLTRLKKEDEKSNKDEGGVTTEEIIKIIEDSRLISLSISDPYTIKELAVMLTDEFLRRRKKQFKVKPYILFVFDEAQEFVRDLTSARGIDRECSESIETLLRQGRKYGLGGCIATQRIAYLNTSALQQLHTYFVGTLPRPYDRSVVSNTFTIDNGILEKTLEFAPGEWLLSSYIATGIDNVPIFIKAENSEKNIQKYLETT